MNQPRKELCASARRPPRLLPGATATGNPDSCCGRHSIDIGCLESAAQLGSIQLCLCCAPVLQRFCCRGLTQLPLHGMAGDVPAAGVPGPLPASYFNRSAMRSGDKLLGLTQLTTPKPQWAPCRQWHLFKRQKTAFAAICTLPSLILVRVGSIL